MSTPSNATATRLARIGLTLQDAIDTIGEAVEEIDGLRDENTYLSNRLAKLWSVLTPEQRTAVTPDD